MEIRYKRVVILTLLVTQALIVSVTSQSLQQSQSKPAPKSSDPIVLNVTVTDKHGGFVGGLEAKDFEISINKKPAHIVSVSHADLPLNVGILLDSSGSMGPWSQKEAERTFLRLREALKHFLDLSNQGNDYFVLGFNIKPQLLVDWTSEPATVVDNIRNLQVYGNTALYDAGYLAVDKVRSGRHAKQVLIVISDGQDNISHYTFNELRDALKESNAMLYATYFPNSGDAGSGLMYEGLGVLEELTFLSGGKLFSSKDGAALQLKDANGVFENIAIELRNQYTITIVPNEGMAINKWQKVKVKVNVPAGTQRDWKGLSARTRDGFYAH